MQKEQGQLLDRRLVAYAIASATVVGGGSLAQAGIIRSGELNISMPANAPLLNIDLDYDGAPDAVFLLTDSDNIRSFTLAVRPHNTGSSNVAGIVVDGTVAAGKDAAANLSGGFAIGDSLSSFNWSAISTSTPMAKIQTWDTISGAALVGNFPGANEKYLGFRLHLSSNEDLVYGWFKVSTVGNLQDIGVSGDIVIHEWAFESTPGAPITTGEVPEPTSLAIFALGGAGIAAWKRRRKVA